MNNISIDDTKIILEIGRKLLDGVSFAELYPQKLFEKINTMIFYKDSKSCYLGTNKYFSEISGINDLMGIVGKTDFDMPWTQTQSEHFRDDDQEVLFQRRPKLTIEETQQQIDGKEVINLTDKFPIYSSDKTRIGLVGIAVDITAYKLMQKRILAITEHSNDQFPKDLICAELLKSIDLLDKKINQSSKLIIKGKKIDFTPRQVQCLSLLIQGKTHKQIAKVLNLSHRTVEEYVNQIKYKMDCRTKGEVVESILSMRSVE